MTMEKGTEIEGKEGKRRNLAKKKEWLFGTFHPTWKAIRLPSPCSCV